MANDIHRLVLEPLSLARFPQNNPFYPNITASWKPPAGFTTSGSVSEVFFTSFRLPEVREQELHGILSDGRSFRCRWSPLGAGTLHLRRFRRLPMAILQQARGPVKLGSAPGNNDLQWHSRYFPQLYCRVCPRGKMLSLFRIMTQQTKPIYNIQLSAGLGLLDETRSLLDLWEPGMSPSALHEAALASGPLPNHYRPASIEHCESVLCSALSGEWWQTSGAFEEPEEPDADQ